MGGHKPVVIIIDEDPTMKVAIERVFTGSSHRFCMWHIMKKLSKKIGVSLNVNIDFNSHFKLCVWNSEFREEFEMKWTAIISDLSLEENGWLSQMYELKHMWIPAYFKDMFLAGILRTTSRSESENSFFGNYLNKNLSLVGFWMRFDSAMESQRHNELITNNNTLTTMPELKLHKELEKYGRQVYTHANFYIFQGELWSACVDCGVEGTKEENGQSIIFIVEHIMVGGKKVIKLREVIYNPSNHIVHCSCKMFESKGMSCRHILFVLKDKGLNEIPSQYIINRWTKLATSTPIIDYEGNVLEACSKLESGKKLVSDAWAQLFECMHIAGTSKEKLLFVINEVVGINLKLNKMKDEVGPSKLDELESFVSSNVSKDVDILPPGPSNTEGCGKRMKGGKEKAIEQQQKRTRHCKTCRQCAYHDS